MTIKIGILGAARAATYALIAPASKRRDCQVVALASSDPARGKAYAREHGIARVHGSYEDLINDDEIDLVYNALPPTQHADLSIKAVEAGKHVLCEKPFAANAEEAAQMVAAAQASRRVLIEAMHYRFHPAFQQALKSIRSNEIGRIIGFRAHFFAPVPFDEDDLRYVYGLGGGSLMDMGCYPLHWVRSVMGCEPEVVEAECDVSEPGIDLTTRAKLAFRDEVIAEIECSMDEAKPFSSSLTVWGSTGILEFDNPLLPQEGHEIVTKCCHQTARVTVAGQGTYDHQLDHVLKAVRGEVTPIGGGRDAINNMRVIDAIYAKAGLPKRGLD